MGERFRDDAVLLAELGDRIDVRCPACGGHAFVTRGAREFWLRQPPRVPSRLRCHACTHATSTDERAWLGPVRGTVRTRCPRCGRWAEESVPGPRHPHRAHLTCPCGCAFEGDITWHEVREPVTDPVFGLPLWFQAPFRGETLWAYNLEHLAFLHDYVAAGLRERAPGRNASLASRLPAWIKAAGNREALLAAIERLRQRT